MMQLSNRKEHIERIRQKAKTADGLGPFWRGILLSALDCIDAERKLSDNYGLALMMIREGCAEPAKFAGEILGKNDPNGERATVTVPEQSDRPSNCYCRDGFQCHPCMTREVAVSQSHSAPAAAKRSLKPAPRSPLLTGLHHEHRDQNC